MVTACSITVQSLLKIVQRDAAVGAKIWCLYVFWGFLPAQRIRKRGLWYGKVAGWLGGCVTVTHRYCIKTAKPTLKLFRPSASPIILVFLTRTVIPNAKGNPFSWGYSL